MTFQKIHTFQYPRIKHTILISLLCALAACGGHEQNTKSLSLNPAPAIAADQVFNLPRSSFSIIKTDSTIDLMNLTTGEIRHLPLSTGIIQFADVKVDLQMETKVKAISASDLKTIIELYVAYFNRVPDAEGLAYWMQRKHDGMSLKDISESFYASAIYYSKVTGYRADMSNADLVRIIYQNVLARNGDTAPPEQDIQYWVKDIVEGRATKGSMVLSILTAAHIPTTDPSLSWVSALLDNKWSVAQEYAVSRGLSMNDPESAIIQTQKIAQAVTSQDTSTALSLINYVSITPVANDDKVTSIAHRWNDVILNAIRGDRVRPPVQARNLFHISAAMYDAWSIYDASASQYLLGKNLQGYTCTIPARMKSLDTQRAREKAISYAAYRLIEKRYQNSPKYAEAMVQASQLMASLGYDTSVESQNYAGGDPAALGNYIAKCYIEYGLQDGSNEVADHANLNYQPINPLFDPKAPGVGTTTNLDHWQPIALAKFIDQAGNEVLGGAASFLNAEWGRVKPFSLSSDQKTVYNRDNFDYPVYLDPGKPPMLNGALSSEYQWSYALVSKWSSHLDPRDGVMLDISPASMGNNQTLPQNFVDQRNFYKSRDGGDIGMGYASNPITKSAYAPNVVPRGDYTRVIAEFWADGPTSETPPGHWFTILNSVVAHPQFKRQFKGEGKILGSLEWDVKAYFALGGAMHDSAIAAWGIKGWYDGTRPITAIRGMATLGQSSDPKLAHYHAKGIPLEPGFIELVGPDDALVGANKEHLNKIKIKAWRGPTVITDSKQEYAGVDWILAENWWPYQRPSFVTPPFAGYISGHSTYSRAAAEVLTAITGSAYFPGGLGSFTAKKDAFLVFERGPSTDVTLQWATYRDASDQSSLSRIWGGIHPPMDDIAGRLIGAKIGTQSVVFAERYFAGQMY